MNASTTRTTSSIEARNLRWLLDNLVDEVPGIRSVAVVSSDGLLLLSSDPEAAEPSGADGGNGSDGTGTGADTGADTGNGPQGPGAGSGGSGPKGSSADLATIVSGVGALTLGAAKLMDGGDVKQTMITMDEGSVFVMAVSDGSLLGVHATSDCDMSVIAYHMALFVGRAGHVLTPELRTELRKSMELDQ
ncbi:roadblock/LC7 domain-containing protein [Streptomyces daliensis]|uniref:Roadblock/LC7 domain-containing protein n=1 Tax=Streptomyces daliensis TaxID=299421 RepID=A0A8T4IUJ4_9ACTN|nr:roadblock/LC7 domain-containing protein [Streptomyces daliensis]